MWCNIIMDSKTKPMIKVEVTRSKCRWVTFTCRGEICHLLCWSSAVQDVMHTKRSSLVCSWCEMRLCCWFCERKMFDFAEKQRTILGYLLLRRRGRWQAVVSRSGTWVHPIIQSPNFTELCRSFARWKSYSRVGLSTHNIVELHTKPRGRFTLQPKVNNLFAVN